jgi:hypothetical protein
MRAAHITFVYLIAFCCLGRSSSIDAHETRFNAAVFHLGSAQGSHNSDIEALTKVLNQRTQVDPTEKTWLQISEDEIDKAPPFLWIFIAPQANWSEALGEQLRRYLSKGGTLVLEMEHFAAQAKVDQLRAEVFPDQKLRALKQDELLMRTFYILPPKMSSSLKTISRAGRVVWVEAARPLLKGLSRSTAQREQRLRTCVNIVLYALTGSYKDDLTHLKFLMRRQKR